MCVRRHRLRRMEGGGAESRKDDIGRVTEKAKRCRTDETGETRVTFATKVSILNGTHKFPNRTPREFQ